MPRECRLAPGSITLLLFFTFCTPLLLLSSAGAQVPDPADRRVLSFSEVEKMSDGEYWAYVYEGFAALVDGHAWGERLLEFMQMNASLASVQQVESSNSRTRGNAFWVAVHPPTTSGMEYYYRDDLNALMIPRIPIDQIVAGAILAHELQHAYDRVMSPDTQEVHRVNNTFVEMQAYMLMVGLMDNYTDGEFSRILETIIEEKEYKVTRDLLYRPNDRGRARLGALFGPPSPWELELRDVLYVTALSYSQCDNPVERSYATAMLKGFDWIFGAPPYEHIGRDLAGEVGETIPSPINGTVVRIEGPGLLKSSRSGLVLQGTGPDTSLTYRLLGIETELAEGTAIAEGEPLGSVQDPRDLAKGARPFFHIELYEDGNQVDPWDRISKIWPSRSDAHAFRWAQGNRTLQKTLEKALEAEKDRKYTKAVDLFRESLPEPWYEATTSQINHYLARSLVNLGDFDAAVEVQRDAVRLIEKELAYAEGALPDPELGCIGIVFSKEYLEVYLIHMKANLEAYERGQQTIYVY